MPKPIPILLVGCKSDLRWTGKFAISSEAILSVMDEIGACGYAECSALKDEGIEDVVKAMAKASLTVARAKQKESMSIGCSIA